MKTIYCIRQYCKSVAYPLKEIGIHKAKLDFAKLHHPSKVPDQPVKEIFPAPFEEVEIDTKTIQLLERLSLVNLDGKEALKTLQSSIQFAVKIANINTTNTKPLYTVLEEKPLHLRIDHVSEGNCRDEILQNAKLTDEDYFISPPGNIPLQQEDKSSE